MQTQEASPQIRPSDIPCENLYPTDREVRKHGNSHDK